jgi:hypothetical protein
MDGLVEMKKNSIAQSLQKAQLLRAMGDNLGAEQEIRSARNYGLSSLIAPEAKAFETEGAFRQPDIALKQAQDLNQNQTVYGGVDATQGGLLAEMRANYTDPTTGKLNAKDYNRQLETLGLGITGMNLMDKGSDTPENVAYNNKVTRSKLSAMLDPVFNNQRQAYKDLQADQKYSDQQTANLNAPIIKANGDIESYNKNADAANRFNAQYKKSYTGNAPEQLQGVIDDTLIAVKNAKTYDDMVSAYTKGYSKYNSINNHYGWESKFPTPDQFGVAKSGGTKGVELVDYYYGKPGSTSTDLVQIPKYMLGDDAKIQAYIKQKYNRFYADDKSLISKAGTDQGSYLNPYEETKKRGEDFVYNAALAEQIQKEIDASGTGLFTRDSVKLQNFRDKIKPQGLDIVENPIVGGYKIVPLSTTTPASNGTEMKHLDKFKVK